MPPTKYMPPMAKKIVIVVFVITLMASIILWLYTRNVHNYFAIFDITNTTDTLTCTLENYQTNHKNGPSENGLQIVAYNNHLQTEVFNYKIKSESLSSDQLFIGYKSPFIWFLKQEKLILVYPFKKDSILRAQQANDLIKKANPNNSGTNNMVFTFAPTDNIVVANLSNGDEFLVNPNSFKFDTNYYNASNFLVDPRDVYIKETPLAQIEMFRLNKNLSICLKSENERDNIKTKLQFVENQIDIHNRDSCLVFKAINHIVYLKSKGLNVINDNFLFSHLSHIGDSAITKLSSFNTKTAKLNFTISIDSLFDKRSIDSDFKLFSSIYPNTIYLCTMGKQYKKINIITSK